MITEQSHSGRGIHVVHIFTFCEISMSYEIDRSPHPRSRHVCENTVSAQLTLDFLQRFNKMISSQQRHLRLM